MIKLITFLNVTNWTFDEEETISIHGERMFTSLALSLWTWFLVNKDNYIFVIPVVVFCISGVF